MKCFFWISLLCLSFGLNLFGANVDKQSNQRFEKFVNAQGFYQNTVNAVASDKNRYLWFASPNGLIRYDGYSFEYHYFDPLNPESIPNNHIASLLNDSNGKLWIGTQQGLCLYLPDKEQFFPIKDVTDNITLIKEDTKKRVWIASGSSLLVFKAETNQLDSVKSLGKIDLEATLEENKIVDLEFLSDSVLVAATIDGIYKVNISNIEDPQVKPLIFQDDFTDHAITKLMKVDNSLWVGTNKGLFQMFIENRQIRTLESYFVSNTDGPQSKNYQILTLFLDKQRILWVGTARNGLLKYHSEGNEFFSYKHDPKKENGLSSNRINCMFEDDFGVLWIGTAQGGINKLDKNQKPFYNYSYNPYDDFSLAGNLITNIHEENNGRIWISSYGNTICRTGDEISTGETTNLRFERLERQLGQLNQEIVLKLFQDSKGYWWIGTDRGFYFYDDTHGKLHKIRFKQNNNQLTTTVNRVVVQTDEHHILVGGSNVFLLKDPWEYVLRGEAVQVNRELTEMANSFVLDFVKDGFGQYWFATRNGIYWIANEKEELRVKKHLTTTLDEDSLQLSHNYIFCIHNNLNKDIWAGTFGGGLMDIQLNPVGKPEKIKVYHKKEGLPDEAIYGILEDDKGVFWLSTDMGICKFDPITEKINVYDVNDGIANYNFRQSAYLKTKSGIMLMGGLNGLTVFDPKEILENKIPPKILISKLKINNQPVLTGQKVNGQLVLKNAISQTNKLVLKYTNRNIILDIIVQHSAANKKNRLSYKLEGVNKDWIEAADGKATATYTNLNSGTYRFLYKGANSDGVWTEETSELILKVLPPWYLRWFTLLFWLALVLFITFVIFNYLVRLVKLKQRLKFEQMDKERLHEMDQAKLRFFTNISHEFKTPLSLIIGPLEKIAEEFKRPDNQKYFSLIQTNITRLQRLIDQLISYRKAETGYLELKYSRTTLGDFIYPLLEAFEENAKRTSVNFFYKVYNADREIVIDCDKTERILLNLFSNAVKFTGLDGNVSIEAGFRDDDTKELLYINVTDNGIGIHPDKIGRIFERFYRAVDEKEAWEGTGIGLALCKSIIDLMKGTISVESIPNERTCFSVALPFTENESILLENEKSRHRRFVTDLLPIVVDNEIESGIEAHRLTLLIIDDSPDVRVFLKEAFQQKYNIVLAINGKDGLEKLKQNTVHLVVCDVMMPEIDGFEFCHKLKEDSETCHVPIILLTALDDDENKIKGLEYGADDYISKPFSTRHLEIKIEKLIENKQKLKDYFSKNTSIPDNSIDISTRDKEFLETLNQAIEKNISDSNFGVEELASEIGISPSHFYRKLKLLTGQVPNAYLRNYRLHKAVELMESNKGYNNIELMYQIGIESYSHFSSSFKKLFGVSPSNYNKKTDAQ